MRHTRPVGTPPLPSGPVPSSQLLWRPALPWEGALNKVSLVLNNSPWQSTLLLWDNPRPRLCTGRALRLCTEASTGCPSFPSAVLGKLQEVVVIPSCLIVVFLKAETEKRVLHDLKEKHTWERRAGIWTTHLTWHLQRRAVTKSCHFSLLPLAHGCGAQGAVDPSPKCHYTALKPPAKLWVSTTVDLWVVCSQ